MTRLAALLFAFLVLLVAAPCARGADEAFSDALSRAMERQDRLAEEGRFDEVMREAQEGLRENTPDAHYLLGRALGNRAVRLQEEGDENGFTAVIEDARDAFGRAKELGGLLYAPALLGLARCARIERDLQAAEKELRGALRIAPAFKAAALELAQVLWERGLHADAEMEIRRLLERAPQDSDARMLLGSLKMTRKRWGEAEREFRVILAKDAENTTARKLLAACLMYREEYEDSAREWQLVLAAEPQDAEAYATLFRVYLRLDRREHARNVLEDLITNMPGSEAATAAQQTLEDMDANPAYGADAQKVTLELLIQRLEEGDDALRAATLHEMRDYEWRALPAQVYKLLSADEAPPPVRRAAVMLIGQHADARTLPLLEILLFHGRERERDVRVRRAVGRALARLDTPAAVPLLYRMLHDPDAGLRESGVQGIASRTGKWFREVLETPTAGESWPAELDAYERWWNSLSGSLCKGEAMEAMVTAFAHIKSGRPRLAQYALDGMDDRRPTTWKKGYALFRALSGETFGHESGSVADEDRRRITEDARRWTTERVDEGPR